MKGYKGTNMKIIGKKLYLELIVASFWYLITIILLSIKLEMYLNSDLVYLFVSLVNMIGLLIIIKKNNQLYIFDFSLMSFLKGILVAAPLTIYTVYTVLDGIYEGINDFGSIGMNKQQFLIWGLGYFIGAGMCEEILSRGIYLNIFMTLLNGKRKVLLSMCYSSLLFGGFHFVNLFNHQVCVTDVVGQIIYSFGFGMLFAAIYIKVKNLWVNIVLHSLFDIGQSIYYECFSQQLESNTEILGVKEYLMVCTIICFITVGLSLFIVKEKNTKTLFIKKKGMSY